jgi:hypothetical protein
MKLITIVFLILISTVNSCGQESKSTEQKLKKLFRNSVQKEDVAKKYVHPWRSDNDDSLYFKSDTIKVYQYKTRSYRSFGCEKINWVFSNENEFVLRRVHLCMEPPTRDISQPNDSLKINFKKRNSKLLIEFNHYNKNIDKFELIDIKENDITTDLILKRILE